MAEERKEVETGKAEAFYVPEPKKLIRVPEFAAKGAPAKRSDPFILTDYRGVDAYQSVT
jgi:hypothetical protein